MLSDRIAMCTNPNGLHEHVPLKPDEPMPTTCFADCDCTPVEYVRIGRETFVWRDGTIYDPSLPGYREATADELARNVPDPDQRTADLMRESRIARARGLAQAIAECRDDAVLDGIREGAAEIVVLLKGRS